MTPHSNSDQPISHGPQPHPVRDYLSEVNALAESPQAQETRRARELLQHPLVHDWVLTEKVQRRLTSERHNIFEALGVAHKENYHSRFMGYLLSPSGEHDQDDVFLRALLQWLVPHPALSPTVRDSVNAYLSPLAVRGTQARITTELDTGGNGRIDLVIEKDSGIKAFDIYGLSEIIGPGVGSECSMQNGLHLFEDHFYPEIIDPASGEVLPDGEEGELVLTTLSKRAMPMIRYRTRDITRLLNEPCACGRSVRRIARVARRSDDMFIIRGVNVFPSQIETALLSVEGVLPHYRIILSRERGLDQVGVEIEVSPEAFSDKVSVMEALHGQLSHAIERIIGIRANVRLVEPHSLPRSEGKAKRVWDERGD